jgi:hypothetical protein
LKLFSLTSLSELFCLSESTTSNLLGLVVELSTSVYEMFS